MVRRVVNGATPPSVMALFLVELWINTQRDGNECDESLNVPKQTNIEKD